MRVLCDQQGTPEWHEARRGKITASAARFALAARHTKGRRLYVERLANDLDGIPNFDEEEPAPWFTDGKYYESWARGWYSWNHDAEVWETGFVVHDDYSWLGASPDGFVDPDDVLEIKYRKTLRTWYQHKSIGMNASVQAQAQTQLLVTGRRRCQYVNYWRSDDHELEKGHVKTIERDDAYINSTLLPAFVGLWNEVLEVLRERGVVYTPPG